MGELRPPPPAKLFVAMLVAPDVAGRVDRIDGRLIECFGPIDLVSPDFSFEFTDYYKAEMGENLVRRIVSFESLFDPAGLPAVKHRTNDLEAELTAELRNPESGRAVNLDAGYLTLGQLVLATTKSHAHRLYLRDGIWAEVTLRYHKGDYEKWPWTYPDYASGRYNSFWRPMRDKLKRQMEETQSSHE
ncbi:MAG: DUF4416 family protein [Phycisphaerae bacterium]|nr:DUF4416 family protein [Phycisphaerae bacterium]